jgi:hypothetical protein
MYREKNGQLCYLTIQNRCCLGELGGGACLDSRKTGSSRYLSQHPPNLICMILICEAAETKRKR